MFRLHRKQISMIESSDDSADDIEQMMNVAAESTSRNVLIQILAKVQEIEVRLRQTHFMSQAQYGMNWRSPLQKYVTLHHTTPTHFLAC